MIDVLAGLIGASTIAVPATTLVARSMRGLRREARRADRLAASLDAARYQARHDPLTGLLNRAGFIADAGAMLADPGAGPVAVGLVDLNRFKAVNDTYGHGAGDVVLASVAHRLTSVAGRRALVGRLGGDEFAVALPATETSLLADGLTVHVQVDQGMTVEVTASVGLASSDSSDELAVLLARADAAMYRAKSAHGAAAYDPRRDDDTDSAGGRPAIRTRDLPVDEFGREVTVA